MLSVETEPQIHHISELLSKQTYCVYYCIFSLSVLLMLWHLGPFVLEGDCPSWCYFTIEIANSFLTESMSFSYINESTQASSLLIHLCLWPINSGLSHTRARSLSTRQPQRLESIEFTDNRLLTLLCLVFPAERQQSLSPSFLSLFLD